MIQKIVFALIIFFLIEKVNAQPNLEDVIYLKNGSIVRGIIIEQIPFQLLKIQTRDRNVFVFKMEEVERMMREITNPDKDSGNKFELKKSGFSSIFEINRAWASKENSNLYNSAFYSGTFLGGNSYGFKYICGYRFSKFALGGIGIGLDIFSLHRNGVDRMRFVPVTLDFRSRLTNTRWSPSINFATGYAIGVNGFGGGGIVNFQLGCDGFVTDNLSVFFYVGYKLQGRNQYYTNPQNGQNFTKKITFDFLTLNTGFSF